jgi:hypothetical protein
MSYTDPQEPQRDSVIFAILVLLMLALLCLWPYALRKVVMLLRPPQAVLHSDPFEMKQYVLPVDR